VSTTVEIAIALVLALPAILLVAFVASRLLGVRRSWAAVLASGVLGYVIGNLVALVAAGFDLESSGFLRDVAVFSVVATMLVAILFDLLAKPGTLATGDTAGLIAVSHPVRQAREMLQPVSRYREIVSIARRNGFGPALGFRHKRDAEAELPVGARLRQTLEECGGMFVKLGQIASTRSDILPPSITSELAKLQSGAPPAPADEVKALLERELKAPVEKVFATFDWEPLAAASIAQAHAATLHTGESVVVKVQRPGIQVLVERDVQVLLQLAHTAQERTVYGAKYDVLSLAKEFADSLAAELDFTVEGRNALTIAANIANDPNESGTIYVPKVYAELSTSKVLVQERLPGLPLGEDLSFAARVSDVPQLTDALLHSFLHQMLVDGLFHSDPHPGNVFILDDDRIGLIDFGATGLIDPITRDALKEMVLAVTNRDAHMLRQAVAEVTVISPDTDDAALERALAQFMAAHVQPGAGIDAAAINDLIPLFRDFGINLPVGLTAFGRTLVTLEGTLHLIDPDYSMPDGIQRFAARWKEDNLDEDDLDALARQELIKQLPTLHRLPGRIDDLTSQLTRGELTTKVSLFAKPADQQFVAKMVNRGVLAFVGGSTIVVSAVLAVTDAGPEFAGEATMLNFLGYVGLLGGSILLLRVVAGVVRDGVN
jgi:ubiquinone biosynthesis protein